MRIQPINNLHLINNNYQNKNCIFRKKDDVIDDGDYVKISKTKYKRYKYGEYADWCISIALILYWLYQTFNKKPPKL